MACSTNVPLLAALTVIFVAQIAVIVLANPFGSKQSVSVAGVLKCNGKPSVGTKVKLYDNDHFTPDDLMAHGKTDNNGHFKLSGSAKETFNIDPKLNVYHKCHGPPMCKWKFTIQIPKKYISTGSSSHPPVFDAGVLNLEGKFSGQTVDCIN